MSATTTQPTTFELTNLTAPASGKTRAFRLSVITPVGGGTTTVNLLSYIQSIGSFRPQSMTIDNSKNAYSITVSETTFGWTRIINPGQLVTFNYPAVADQIFTFIATSQVTFTVTLYDYPAFPEDLFNNSVGSGSQNVSVTNTPLLVSLPLPYTSNKTVYEANILNNIASATLAVGSAGLVTYCLGYDFSVSGNASLAAAAENLFTLEVGTQIIGKENLYIPAVAGTGGLIAPVVIKRFDYPFLISLGTTPTLTLTSASALVTGHYNVNLYLVDM